ncbi:MAG: carboxypeptidase-like regulatory domain-containing protein [Bacteroidales bacterium]|nr:carboxypeptidase-like regulatory domain-containing protein [Bacteroidales bacterium]
MIPLLLWQPLAGQERCTVSGTVLERGSRETLIGATVVVRGSAVGTATNSYGFYALTLPASDSVELEVSYVGYRTEVLRVRLRRNITLNVELAPQQQLIEAVQVQAEGRTSSRSVQTSVVELPLQQAKAIPMLLGERDLLKALQLMPGVQSGSEGTSGLYIRGGGPDQNLIILDDAPVYNAFHLFGFMSLFNGDAIKSTELIKGGFPARYGGRLSSVLDIAMRDGRKDSLCGEAGIGLLSSRLVLEGPIAKNKASFLVSGRRSYADLLLRPVLAISDLGQMGYFFYDLTAKLNWEVDERNKLYLSGYFGRDKFYIKERYDGAVETTGLFWDNATATMRWNHVFGERLFSNLSAIFSNYRFNIFDNMRNHSMLYMSGIRDYGLKYDLIWYPQPSHTLRMGLQPTLHEFRPQVLDGTDADVGISEHSEVLYRTLEAALYMEDEMRVGALGKVNVGARLSMHHLGRGKTHVHIEPRLSAVFFIDNRSALKASYALMNQYTHLLSNTGIGLPTDLWVPATEQVPAQRSWQVALGYTYDIKHLQTSITIEGYYKESQRIISYLPGASFMDIDVVFDGGSGTSSSMAWERSVTSGLGRAYGVELLAHRKSGRLSGWMGYTLSWNKHRFAALNNGQEFHPKYDRRHDISIVSTFDVNDHITISGTWVYGTGNAVTLEQASYYTLVHGYDEPQQAYYYGPKNSFRMAPYHRLDVGVQLHRQKRRTLRTWELGLYNAYSRRNPYFYYTATKTNADGIDVQKLMYVSLFPILPSVSWSIKF